jgi:hypothetical protein
MRYSLVSVSREENGLVDGVWVQDCTGTLDEAIKRARDTEKANSNRISVAVVESLNGSTPNYCQRTNLERLDQKSK